MAYPYVGPELARLEKRRSFLQKEKDASQRRVTGSKIVTIGSAAILGTSIALGWGMALSGVEHVETPLASPEGIGLFLWSASIPVSMIALPIAIPIWTYNAGKVNGINLALTYVSEDLKRVEKGVLQ